MLLAISKSDVYVTANDGRISRVSAGTVFFVAHLKYTDGYRLMVIEPQPRSTDATGSAIQQRFDVIR